MITRCTPISGNLDIYFEGHQNPSMHMRMALVLIFAIKIAIKFDFSRLFLSLAKKQKLFRDGRKWLLKVQKGDEFFIVRVCVCVYHCHMVVSWNRGTSKSSILGRLFPSKPSIFGFPILGNLHIAETQTFFFHSSRYFHGLRVSWKAGQWQSRCPPPVLVVTENTFTISISPMWSFPKVGVPSNHPFLDGIFHEINHPAMKGYSHGHGTPQVVSGVGRLRPIHDSKLLSRWSLGWSPQSQP